MERWPITITPLGVVPPQVLLGADPDYPWFQSGKLKKRNKNRNALVYLTFSSFCFSLKKLRLNVYLSWDFVMFTSQNRHNQSGKNINLVLLLPFKKHFYTFCPEVLTFLFLWAIAALYGFTWNGPQDEKKKLDMKSRRLVALSGFSPSQQQTRLSLSGKLFLIYI